jgi:SAM-dependent methyltransferase
MATSVDWNAETLRYDRPHPRLRLMARMLAAQPQRRLLDLGCSTATMRRLLPADFVYHGADVATHAGRTLDAVHFQQVDFNRNCDLSAFADRRIDVLHAGGLLEYLSRPAELLSSARDLVPPGAPFVLSIINFQSRRMRRDRSHHPGWIFKPALEELLALLTAERWSVERALPFADRGGWRRWSFRLRAGLYRPDHPWLLAHADQFVLLARAA